MYDYLAFFKGQKLHIKADSQYAAWQIAIQRLKVSKTKTGLLSVVKVSDDESMPASLY